MPLPPGELHKLAKLIAILDGMPVAHLISNDRCAIMTRGLQKTIFGVIVFALALLVATAGYRIVAGENDNKRGDGKVASSGDKGSVSTKWFADPKRGWIRSEERKEQQKRRPAEQERSENSNREKAGRNILDY